LQKNEALFADIGIKSKSELVQFCIANPPYFITSEKIDYMTHNIGCHFPAKDSVILAFNAEIKADGKKEAEITFVNYKGRRYKYLLVSPEKYPFSPYECVFVSSISKLISKHPSSKSRTPFMHYPTTHNIAKGLMITDAQTFTGLHNLLDNEKIVKEIMNGIRSVYKQSDVGPKSCSRRRMFNLPNDLLFKWFTNGSDGSFHNFAFMRNSFAANVGAMFALRVIFMSQMPITPTIAMFDDRIRVTIPGFFVPSDHTTPLPFTEQICGALPKFVMHGSLSTAFSVVMQSLNTHKEESFLYTTALTTSKEFTHRLVRSLAYSAPIMSEDTDKYIDPFPFTVVQNLIDTGSNSFKAQCEGFAWI
jgi:hypothetical protein